MLTHSDIASLMRGAAPAIRDLVVATVQPLVERIAELDQTVAGLRKELAERDEPAEAVTPEQAASMIADAIAGLPVAQDGQSVTPEDILLVPHDFPGRSPTIRVDAGPVLDKPADMVAAMRRGATAYVVFHVWPRGEERMTVSLAGFSEAYDLLKAEAGI